MHRSVELGCARRLHDERGENDVRGLSQEQTLHRQVVPLQTTAGLPRRNPSPCQQDTHTVDLVRVALPEKGSEPLFSFQPAVVVTIRRFSYVCGNAGQSHRRGMKPPHPPLLRFGLLSSQFHLYLF
ncbi:hypothetical protein [Nocardia amamiensis]|uniref:hypothetical protein n=1 Tax=Nocardia amamiensis TaxID=404578 RepID=UPI0034DD8E2B